MLKIFAVSEPWVLKMNMSINDAGQVLIMGRSSSPTDFNKLSTIGLYLKSPGMPLKLIVDQSDNNAFNTASTGAPRPPRECYHGSIGTSCWASAAIAC